MVRLPAARGAHAPGILHRDIKPENVIQASPGHGKVADFGIARCADAARVQTQAARVSGSDGEDGRALILLDELTKDRFEL